MRVTNLDNEKYNCTGICDYQMEAAEELPYWAYDGEFVPVFLENLACEEEYYIDYLQASLTGNQQEVFMLAPLGTLPCYCVVNSC